MTISIPKTHIIATAITIAVVGLLSLIISSARSQPTAQTGTKVDPFQQSETFTFDEPLIMHVTPLATLPAEPSNAPLRSVLGEPQLDEFIDPSRSVTPNSSDEKINELINKYNELDTNLKKLGVLGTEYNEPVIEFNL